jgi:hypothetical protein
MGRLSPGTKTVARSVVVALSLAAASLAQAQGQPPRFQSGVEVTTVDVTVVDGDGRPILNLQPADFVVEVDGRRRRVVSAEWVPLTPNEPPIEAARISSDAPGVPTPEPYTSNETSTGGRLIVLFIDRLNIRFEGMVAHRAAIAAFLDRLQPFDRVALVVDGFGTASNFTFTTNRERVKDRHFTSRWPTGSGPGKRRAQPCIARALDGPQDGRRAENGCTDFGGVPSQ